MTKVASNYSVIAFYTTIVLAYLCFAAFCAIAWAEMRQKSREARGRHYESLPNPGDLAVKFASAGLAPSTLACAVVFMLIGTAIGLTLDNRSLLALFTTP
jgi:predicted permease